MFEAAASMTKVQLTSVAYYTMLALEHWVTPERLRRAPILAGIAGEPSKEEQEIACRWLEEIQKQENRPIDQFDDKTILRYTGQLSRLVVERAESERKTDPQRAQQLLEDLRRAVPLPSELRLRRAG